MKKQELAARLAEALNHLDNLHSTFGDDYTPRQVNDWHGLVAKLPDEVRENLRYNGTVKAEELV